MLMRMRTKLLAASSALMLSAGAAAAAPAIVSTDLNMRSGPGTEYGVVTTMPAGATVDVGACSGSWCAVNFRGASGYASASYLSGAASADVLVEPDYGPGYAYGDDFYDYGYSYGPSIGFYAGPRFRHGWRGRPGWQGHRTGHWQGRPGWQGQRTGNWQGRGTIGNQPGGAARIGNAARTGGQPGFVGSLGSGRIGGGQVSAPAGMRGGGAVLGAGGGARIGAGAAPASGGAYSRGR